MSINKLWAPWRIEYITNPKSKDCFFCQYIKEDLDDEHFIVCRKKHAFVIMNYYPYNNGHLMVVPYSHVPTLADLDSDTRIELMDLLDLSSRLLAEVLAAEGFNIGLNLGSVAGAGVKDHLHFHVVPRWTGDTNFMPVVGHAKVVSEGLKETWQKLRNGFLAHQG
jgi:ATP adenylyltransferase